MSTNSPSEEEMQAAYEAELRRLRVEHVLLEQVVMLVNLGMRRTGLSPGTESERDPAQVQLAIEGVRALLPLLERSTPEQLPAIRQALSQLQLAYVRIGGQPAAPGGQPSAPGGQPAAPGGQPAAPGGQPAAPGGQPAAPGGQPAAPGDGEPAGPAPEQPSPPPSPGEPGPAERSGRLWVPGR
jgi:hypothetical protein